jgi:hypothetical protein
LSVLLRLGILLPVVEFQVAVSHNVEIDEQQALPQRKKATQRNRSPAQHTAHSTNSSGKEQERRRHVPATAYSLFFLLVVWSSISPPGFSKLSTGSQFGG